MGRKPLGSKPLTATEMTRRYRAKRKQTLVESNARRNEWGTPLDIIAAAREVMGEIDLDPATHPEAQARVQARWYYTAKDNGLECRWLGRVFLNPPYGRGLIDRFVTKLMVEGMSRHVTEAIVLVNAQTDTLWFRNLQEAAQAYCFHSGRVRFLNSDGKPGMPLVGQAIFYYGYQPDLFARVFAKFGHITVDRTTTPEAVSLPPGTTQLRLIASAEQLESPTTSEQRHRR